MEICLLQKSDYESWLPLWDANNMGKHDDMVTAQTWARIINPDISVFGLGAFEDKKLSGILHYILHPTTGSLAPVCYMQDLYVDPPRRNKGIARALVQELASTGEREKWTRIYWLADAGNIAAQALYKTLGVKLDFTLHVLPIGKIA